MRIDHIAYRTKDRNKTAKFFIDALGYKIQEEFTIDFNDGTHAKCIALEPPEKQRGDVGVPWVNSQVHYWEEGHSIRELLQVYHMPMEIFVSDGEKGSIVGDWVEKRNGIGGIHHIAYQVESVEATMKEWKEKGYAEFSTDEPMKCEGLTQVFTKPSELTGVIYEFIERGVHGFCVKNVRNLMLATSENK